MNYEQVLKKCEATVSDDIDESYGVSLPAGGMRARRGSGVGTDLKHKRGNKDVK